jgi:hypothetical protein
MTGSSTRCFVVLGSPDSLLGSRCSMVIAELLPGSLPDEGHAWLRVPLTARIAELHRRHGAGNQIADHASLYDLRHGMCSSTGTGFDAEYIPLLLGLAAARPDRAVTWMRTYLQTVIRNDSTEFLAFSPEIPAGASCWEWAEHALAEATQLLPLELPRKHPEWPEIELKAMITAASAMMPVIAGALRSAIIARQFPGWAAFDSWPPIERRSFTFEMHGIDAPEDERGYVSYFLSDSGELLCKRKWFTHDSVMRKEVIMTVRDALTEQEATERLLPPGAKFTAFPRATRLRYKQKIFSVNTGNIYNVILDQVQAVNTANVMRQAEFEYSATAAFEPTTTDIVLSELEGLFELVERWFGDNGLYFSRTVTSKLSFLREITKVEGR